MSIQLERPTDDLARRVLAAVSYRDRIPAGRLTARLGIMRGTVRGLPELHLYLTPDDQSLPAISLERVADWIERVIADAELAREVWQAAGAAASYVDACIALHALVGHRLTQARHVLGVGDGATLRERRA
jgi:hypothetical protein